jgi:hypothetical protein
MHGRQILVCDIMLHAYAPRGIFPARTAKTGRSGSAVDSDCVYCLGGMHGKGVLVLVGYAE